MPKLYTNLAGRSPKPPKNTWLSQKLAPVTGFFKRRWEWYKGLSKPKKFFVIAGPILAFLILTPLITYIYYANTISDPEQLLNYNNTGIVLQDKDGETFYSYGTADRGERLPLDQISDYTEQALISAEDKNFYEHNGFSLISILGALFANVSSGDLTAYGGSTLTQQLAKNTVLYDDQTIFRKYQELAIAVAIEQQYSKDEILDLYLNSVYYGEGAFGIGNAAKTYFGKSANDLTLAESAMLIGVLPAPSAYSPISGNIEYAKERQATVLDRMVDNKAITKEESDAAKAQELAYADPEEGVNDLAPHFAEMVIAQLYDEYGEERVTRSGFKVKTTLDLDVQRAANTAVDGHIGFIQANGGSNAAVVAIDPTTGELRALVGSADYDNEEFGKVNMANSARQPGSSIKPLYYTEAMQRGLITPATIIEDKPTDFGGGYTPQNADRRFRGDVTVRNALAQSLNIPAVDVMKRLGVSSAIEALQRMGITTLDASTDYGLSLALGSAEAKLTDMTNAYAGFANNGQQYSQTTILEIEDKFDKKVFTHNRGKAKTIMGEDATFLVSDILNDESARAPIFGSSLNTNGYDVAVKTGTTDDARDAWTIGYSKRIAVGVWVGNNDNAIMSNGGSAMAGPIWRSTILAALQGEANVPFTKPSGVERLTVCRSNGLRAVGGGTQDTYQEYFIRSAVPQGTCEVPKEPEDSDKDGVNDEDDACANTPANTEVDEGGCPVEEEEEPGNGNGNGNGNGQQDVDTDGDGVLDADDACANTPVNTEVDEGGCPVDETDPETTPTGALTPVRRDYASVV